MNGVRERPEHLIGVLLAAGRGRRMEKTKQLLPWPTAEGEKPLIAAAFDAIAPICREMIVVLGHERDAVAAALGDRTFHPVESDPEAAMFESIRLGLRAAQALDDRASIVLHPADHPEVHPPSLTLLLESGQNHNDCAVMPEYEGQGGHPVIIPAGITAQIIDYSGAGGLRRFWIDHPEFCRRIPVLDSSVVRDIDTPEQYQAAAGGKIP